MPPIPPLPQLPDSFRFLRPDPGRIWQGDWIQLPVWVEEPGERAERPWGFFWLDPRIPHVHPGTLVRRADRALESFVDMAVDPEGPRRLPGIVEVTDPEVAGRLTDLLSPWSITVRVVRRLSPFDQVVRDLRQGMEGPCAGAPGLLESGVPLDRIRSFAAAAAEFYRARPWRLLSHSDEILIRSPAPARDLTACLVTGLGESPPGVLFFDARPGAARRGRDRDPWSVTYGPLSWLPIEDAELWIEHELARAGLEACPSVTRGSGRRAARPDAATLAFMEGVLRALADTTEDEIDSGEWMKLVRTAAGEQTVAFQVPALLEPIEFGAEPPVDQRSFDPRAGERLTAAVRQLLSQHEFETVDDVNEFLRREVQGRKLEPAVPDTPLARAQDLAYQAFDTLGRRRVQLARRALEICPDCADAYVIRAEALRCASDLEGALELYRQGIAAGLRAVPPELLQGAERLWAELGARPYLRSMQGAAECLEELDRAEEALALWQELLRLNREDHQGACFAVLRLLLALRRDDEAWEHVEAHRSGPGLIWPWSRALLAYRRLGDGEVSRAALDAALRRSAQVGKQLLREPPEEPPDEDDALEPPDEATACADTLRRPWRETEGAIAWLADGLKLRRARQRSDRKKRGENDRTRRRPPGKRR